MLASRIGTATEPVGCIERHRDTTRQVSIAAGIKGAMRWTTRYRPAEYTCNLMPGLPLWLFWNLHRRGVRCRGIVARGQLEAHSDLSRLLHDAWDLCDKQIVADTISERDCLVREHGQIITIEHVLGTLPPD